MRRIGGRRCGRRIRALVCCPPSEVLLLRLVGRFSCLVFDESSR